MDACRLREGAKALHIAQKVSAALANSETSIPLEPSLLAEGQAIYEWPNRLTVRTSQRMISVKHPMSVRSCERGHATFPWVSLVRASSLHVGAAAAAAALRTDLVESGRLSAGEFDQAYAVARVTPGTNLLAMYVLLGERFRGWVGALIALFVGTVVPATIVVLLGAAYVEVADRPLVQHVMQGARAGALAVFAWAVVRLLRPQLRTHRWRGLAVGLATVATVLVLPVPQFGLLIAAGVVGAAILRETS